MGLFILKKGTFVTGSNRVGDPEKGIAPARSRLYRADDPSRSKGSEGNIVESDIDLAADDPAKFDIYRGVRPTYLDLPDDQRLAVTPRGTLRETSQIARDLSVRQATEGDQGEMERNQGGPEGQMTPAEHMEKPQQPQSPASPPQQEGQQEAQARDVKEYQDKVDRMSLSDLRNHASQRGVDLKGTQKREDIAKILKETPVSTQSKTPQSSHEPAKPSQEPPKK